MDAEAIIMSSEFTILLSVPAKKIIEFAAVADTISPSNNRLGVMYVCATIVFAWRSIRIYIVASSLCMHAISLLMLQSASVEFERTVMSIGKQLHISSCCSKLVSQIICRVKDLKKQNHYNNNAYKIKFLVIVSLP